MTEFKIGDIVSLTKGEPDRPGYESRVREVSYDRVAPGMIELAVLHVYEEKGWTVELIERPAVSERDPVADLAQAMEDVLPEEAGSSVALRRYAEALTEAGVRVVTDDER